MKQVDEFLNRITFDQARKNINKQSIQRELVGKENALLSYSVKRILLFVSVFIIPSVVFSAMMSFDMAKIPKEGYYVFLLISFLFIAIVLLSTYTYYRTMKRNSSPFLNRFKYRLLLFLLPEISVAGYSSFFIFGKVNKDNPILLVGSLILYILAAYKIIKLIINTQVCETLNKNYGLNLEIKKWEQFLSRLPAWFLVLSIFGMQVYRTSKSLFILTHTDSPISILYSVIGGFGSIIVAICVSLLPTVFFDGEIFIRGSLLKKYSEEFREEYEFTKEEWYGE